MQARMHWATPRATHWGTHRTILWATLILSLPVLTAVAMGQERPAAGQTPARTAPAEAGLHDLSALDASQRVVYLSNRRAMEWLWRANRPDGLFSSGLNPALNVALEGESFDSQCEAAFALARAGRYSGEAKYTARARQAVLVLLAGTKVDPADPGVRFPVDPSRRLGAAAFLVQAIAELPEPGAELLDQSEQLCQYLRKQQEPDGSFRVLEPASEADASHRFSGQALTAILRSRQQHPAAWKAEAARKALAFYRARWKDQPGLAFAAGHSAACAEGYLLTKEKGFADLAFEMNDWLCGQQYGVETRQPLWRGGFAEGSKASSTPPTVRSLLAAASLVEGCRLARQAGEVQRFNRYQDSLQRGLRFLMTLQYTPANVQHFADSYQPRVAGAFFSSHQNGNVTTDATAQAVLTFTAYLEQVIQLPARAAQSSK